MTDAFRAEAVAYVLARRRTRRLEDLAAEIGVHMRTLHRWLGGAAPRAELAPVVVVESAAEAPSTPKKDDGSRPVVILPSGARVEGLDVAAIAELLRSLG